MGVMCTTLVLQTIIPWGCYCSVLQNGCAARWVACLDTIPDTKQVIRHYKQNTEEGRQQVGFQCCFVTFLSPSIIADKRQSSHPDNTHSTSHEKQTSSPFNFGLGKHDEQNAVVSSVVPCMSTLYQQPDTVNILVQCMQFTVLGLHDTFDTDTKL